MGLRIAIQYIVIVIMNEIQNFVFLRNPLTLRFFLNFYSLKILRSYIGNDSYLFSLISQKISNIYLCFIINPKGFLIFIFLNICLKNPKVVITSQANQMKFFGINFFKGEHFYYFQSWLQTVIMLIIYFDFSRLPIIYLKVYFPNNKITQIPDRKLLKMDQKISIVTQQQEKGVYIAQFKTHDLAIFTYYVESNKECYIIDPTFDSLIFRDFIKKRGSTLKYVILTHYHADFLSAHVDMGVPIIMGEKSKRSVNNFKITEMKDNEKFKLGKVQTRVLATPGHTTQSACYILANQEGHQFCIFTGDTVFLREVGRPDLAVASDLTSADLAGMLFDSITKIKSLDKKLRIYPGHGSGSACGKSIGSGNFCTLGVQHQKNYGFLITDRKQFIQKVTDGLPTPPQYFFHDAKLNQQGSKRTYEQILRKCKKPLSMQDFKHLVEKKKNIIDTRHIINNGLIEGSLWMTLKGDIANWIALFLKPEDEFAVLIEQGKQEQIIGRFIRIGYFNILGYNSFDVQTWNLTKLHVLSLKTYDQLDKDKKYVHLDVRNFKEWQDMGTFEDAVLISLPNLMNEVKQVQRFMAIHPDSDLVVNCKTGGRARLAASILLKQGIKPIILNQNLDNLKEKGFKMTEFKGPVTEDGGCCNIF